MNRKNSKSREAKHKDLSYLEDVFGGKRRFVTPEVGARLYSMRLSLFKRHAKAAGANMVISRHAIVDLNKFNEYIETFYEKDEVEQNEQ